MSDNLIYAAEKSWQQLMITTNENFMRGNFDEALPGYAEALQQAEFLNRYAKHCKRLHIPFMQVFIISCTNLANTYAETGDIENTERLLLRSIYYLLDLSANQMMDENEIQSELKKALAGYFDFLHTHPKATAKSEKITRIIDTIRSHFHTAAIPNLAWK